MERRFDVGREYWIDRTLAREGGREEGSRTARGKVNQSASGSTEENDLDPTISIKWVVISFVVSLILCRFSGGNMCNYMFLSLSWIFLTIIISQSLQKFERHPKQIFSTTAGALLGWIIGTVWIWRKRPLTHLFLD
jgi:hypothetical protein